MGAGRSSAVGRLAVCPKDGSTETRSNLEARDDSGLFRLTDRWYAEAASLSHEIVGDFGEARNGLNGAIGWIRQRECAAASRVSVHPCLRRCCSSALRFHSTVMATWEVSLRIEIALENVTSPESARQPSSLPREIGGNAAMGCEFPVHARTAGARVWKCLK